jgi:chromosome segregation ATPase
MTSTSRSSDVTIFPSKLILGQSEFVIVNKEEYENLKIENIRLKDKIQELEHNSDMLREQIMLDKLTIDELRKENEFLRKKINELERKLEEQERKLEEQERKLEEQEAKLKEHDDKFANDKDKELAKKLVMGLQDLNEFYGIQKKLIHGMELSRMRLCRNLDFHILEDKDTEIYATKVRKCWLYIVENANKNVRQILNRKCGKDTVDEIINFLNKDCENVPIDNDIEYWFME